MLLSIPKSEFLQRQNNFCDKFKSKGAESAVIFSVTDIFYLTGFHFYPTERPIALLVSPNDEFILFVPKLEHKHAEEYAIVDSVESYQEYPGTTHPMEVLKDLIVRYKFNEKNVAMDSKGYGSSMGYRGPSIESLVDLKVVDIFGLVEEMRFIKSENEIELIKESCRWGNLAHALLQEYTDVGLKEIEVTQKAGNEATLAMIKALGSDYKPHGGPAHAIYRGQIGAESAFPHAVTQNATFKKGDTLVTGAGAEIFGYHSELERVMFVNEYSKEQEKYFNLMKEAQEVAFDVIKPGQSYSVVEKEVQKFFRDNGVLELTQHHTGHNIGLLGHEAPFFDLGDETIMEPGMVVTIEPGIYVDGVGGFRHSDTGVIREEGLELLTYYPRDIDSLIC